MEKQKKYEEKDNHDDFLFLENIRGYLKSRTEAIEILHKIGNIEKNRVESEILDVVNFIKEKIDNYILLGNFNVVLEIASMVQEYLNRRISIQEILKKYYEDMREYYIDLVTEIKENESLSSKFADFINNFLLTGEEDRFSPEECKLILSTIINRIKQQPIPNFEAAFYAACDSFLKNKSNKRIVTRRVIINNRDEVVSVLSEDQNLIEAIKKLRQEDN